MSNKKIISQIFVYLIEHQFNSSGAPGLMSFIRGKVGSTFSMMSTGVLGIRFFYSFVRAERSLKFYHHH